MMSRLNSSRDFTAVLRVDSNRIVGLRGSRRIESFDIDSSTSDAIAVATTEWPIVALCALNVQSSTSSASVMHLIAAVSLADGGRLTLLDAASLRQIDKPISVNFASVDTRIGDSVDLLEDDDESTTFIRAHAASATVGIFRANAGQLTVVRVDAGSLTMQVASHPLQCIGSVLDWAFFRDDAPAAPLGAGVLAQWTIAIASGSLSAPVFDMCRVLMRRDSLSVVAASFQPTLPKRTALVVPLGRELAFCGLGHILFIALQSQTTSSGGAVALAQRSVVLNALDGAIVALCPAGANACFVATRRGTLYHVDWRRGSDRAACVAVARIVDGGAVQELVLCRSDDSQQQHLIACLSSVGVMSFVNVSTANASAPTAVIKEMPADRLRGALAFTESSAGSSLLVATPDGLSTLWRGESVQQSTIVEFTADPSARSCGAVFAIARSASLTIEPDSIVLLSLPLPPPPPPTLSASSATAVANKKAKRKAQASDDDEDDTASDDSQNVVTLDDFEARARPARKRTVTKRFREAFGAVDATTATTTTTDVVADDTVVPEAEPIAEESVPVDDDDFEVVEKPPLRKSGSSKVRRKASDAAPPPPPPPTFDAGQDGMTRMLVMTPDGQWAEAQLRDVGKRATLCAGRLVGSFMAIVSAHEVRIVELAKYEVFFKWTPTTRIVSADVSLADILVLEESGDMRVLHMTRIAMKMGDVRTIISWQVTNLPHAVTEASLVALATPFIACTCSHATADDEVRACNAHDNADVVNSAYRAHFASLVVAVSNDSLRLFHVDKGVSDVFELTLRDASDDTADVPTSVVCCCRHPVANESRVVEVLIAFASGLIRSFRIAERDSNWIVAAQGHARVGDGQLVLQKMRASSTQTDSWSAFVFGTSTGPVMRLRVERNAAVSVAALHGTSARNGRTVRLPSGDALFALSAAAVNSIALPSNNAKQLFESTAWHVVDSTDRLAITHLLAVSATARLVVLQANRAAPVLRFANLFGVWFAPATNVPFVAGDAIVAAVADGARSLAVLAMRGDANSSQLRVLRVDGKHGTYEQLSHVTVNARVCSLARLGDGGVVVGADRSLLVYEWSSASSLELVTSLELVGAAVSVASTAIGVAHGGVAIAVWDDAIGPVLVMYKDRRLRLQATCKPNERCGSRSGGLVAIGRRGASAVRIWASDERRRIRTFECELSDGVSRDDANAASSDAMLLVAALTQLAKRREDELECVAKVQVDGIVRSMEAVESRSALLAVSLSGEVVRVASEDEEQE